MIDVYSIIISITKKKKDSHKVPASALYNEVMIEINKQVKSEINTFCKANKLKFHKTLNGLSFDIVQQ